MRKVLVYLTRDSQPSVFDTIVAYDAGADVVIPITSVDETLARDVVYGCVFTRHPRDLRNTAIFVGGSKLEAAEEVVSWVLRTFEGLPEQFRVSVAIDPGGAYTTSAACVAKLSLLGDLRGKRAAVLAGTGPVGQKVAALLGREGCECCLTSRSLGRAEGVCKSLEAAYGVVVRPVEAKGTEDYAELLQDCELVVTTGPPGVQILPERIWKASRSLEALADVNAVPPYGVEGLEPHYDGFEKHGKKLVGALAIGSLKMVCHYSLIKGLFENNSRIFSLFDVYELARSSSNIKAT